MKILVAGGCGFIGSHLCRALLELDHEVIALDNFYTGSESNVHDLKPNKNFEIVNHDVVEPISLDVEGIFNLACPASPVHYQKNPIGTFKTSVLGSMNLLELARDKNARILQASTSEIYGDPMITPQREDYWGNVNPIGIRSCYDEGKRAAETLFTDYSREFKTDIRIARIFNTYGPGMNFGDGRVVSNFIYQSLKGEPLTIYGDGSQTRSFCFVEDTVRGLISLFFSEGITKPINLGNPERISMKDLASEVQRLTGTNSQIEYRDLPSDDPRDREPDISEAKRLLSWHPEISREIGLRRTIEDFKKRLKEVV